ncbi:MAG: hypothetical protein IJY31_05525 [Muribaculaceae bacterium]|nr:hypothetical protein [Muribaculaceae bacterium]
MAKDDTETGKKKDNDTLLLRALHGRLLSTDFFARNWLKVLLVIVMILVYITNKYQCQTRMEKIRALEQELEIVETERVRVRSEYMSRIRESAMQQLVDTMRLNLQVQERPPFMIPNKTR